MSLSIINLYLFKYAAVTGSNPVLLAKSMNIALSSSYWIIGVFIANTLSIAMVTLWESLSKEDKEMIGMTMLTIFTLLITFAASEELV